MVYVIVSDSSINSLVVKVNKQIKKGYKPLGSVVAEALNPMFYQYHQAMIKENNQNDSPYADKNSCRLEIENKELEAENTRMKEALEKMNTINMENPHPDQPWRWGVMDKVWEEYVEMKRIAKQALLKGKE